MKGKSENVLSFRYILTKKYKNSTHQKQRFLQNYIPCHGRETSKEIDVVGRIQVAIFDDGSWISTGPSVGKEKP